MSRNQDGFTLIEMMAVVAIIAILAAMAVPSYLTSITRKQVELAMKLADQATASTDALWMLTETLPLDNAELGLPPPDKIVSNHVKAVAVKDGAINITFGNRANGALKGKILTLRPAVIRVNTPIKSKPTWVCGKAEGPGNTTIEGVDLTNVPEAYLPLACMKRAS
ncbi:MAG: pilin [Pseudomonadota bacterium]